MKANISLLLVILTICSVAKGQDSRRTATLTLDRAREILSHPSPREMLGTIDVQNLNYSREVEIGGGFRVIVLSKNMGGALILFSPQQLAEDSMATNEITWLQLFDLNDDGISELVTEEIEAQGTGILVKYF